MQELPVFLENQELWAMEAKCCSISPALGYTRPLDMQWLCHVQARSMFWGPGTVCHTQCLLVVDAVIPGLDKVCNWVLANNLIIITISCLTSAHWTLRWSRSLWAHLELWAGASALTRGHPWGLTGQLFNIKCFSGRENRSDWFSLGAPPFTLCLSECWLGSGIFPDCIWKE